MGEINVQKFQAHAVMLGILRGLPNIIAPNLG